MTQQRALLTDTEREILAGERDVKDNYRYSVESRVRSRIRGPLADDIRTLVDHEPDLFSELEDVFFEAAGGSGNGDRPDEEKEPDIRLDVPGDDDSDDLAGVEFPAGRDREACLAAVHAARDYLHEEGSATMREIVTAVMPDHSLGYDVPELEKGDRYRGAWWRRVVKPGLEALPDVEKPTGGEREWQYVGSE